MYPDVLIRRAREVLEGIVDDAAHAAAGLADTTARILHPLTGAPADGTPALDTDAHAPAGERRAPSPVQTTQPTLGAGQRQALQHAIRHCLDHTPNCNGAGFASHVPSREGPGYWTLEWWFKDGQSIHPSQLEHNQETRQRLDFRTFGWFEQPARHHRPCVEGPYVDYICNGDYTITAAHPVMVDGHFAGVAAVDVLVSTLERLLLPVLVALRTPSLVVNRAGRVVISTTPRVRTGALWPAARTPGVATHALRLIFPHTVPGQDDPGPGRFSPLSNHPHQELQP